GPRLQTLTVFIRRLGIGLRSFLIYIRLLVFYPAIATSGKLFAIKLIHSRNITSFVYRESFCVPPSGTCRSRACTPAWLQCSRVPKALAHCANQRRLRVDPWQMSDE